VQYFWILDAAVRIGSSLKVCLKVLISNFTRAVGAEVRKVIHDGWPISQTVAADLEAGMVAAVYNNYVD
jgi:hypothetical protein